MLPNTIHNSAFCISNLKLLALDVDVFFGVYHLELSNLQSFPWSNC